MTSITRPLTSTMKGNHSAFQFHGLKTLKPNHPEARLLQQHDQDDISLGAVIWHASYLLVDYLSQLELDADQNILELGCGWGLASTYVKKHFACHVTATDSDEKVLSRPKLLSEINQVSLNTRQLSFTDLIKSDLSRYDTLIGAEICYSPAMTEELLELFGHFADQGGSSIIIADCGNSPFWTLREKASKRFTTDLIDTELSQPTAISGHILHIRIR